MSERVAAAPTDPARSGGDLSDRSPHPVLAVEGPGHVVTYVNPAFARLAGKAAAELLGRPFADAVPEGGGNGCVALLGRVLRTGLPETLAEQEHRQPTPAYWSYAAWATLGDDGRPTGVVVQVTDATETATFRRRAAAVNEALVVSGVRQHELAAAAEALNARLREAHDRLEARVAERTAELEAEMAGRRDLAHRLATAQEDERRRVSRDLHDTVGQTHAGLSMSLKAAADAAPPGEFAARLARARELADVMGRELHDAAVRLRPTVLDDVGLAAALDALASDWTARREAWVDVQTVGLDGDRLPPEVETALYRVIQEALTNAARHARARRMAVVVSRFQTHATAVVEDDGVGFDPSADTGRLGLLGMTERVAQVGGTLQVESAPDAGTAVYVRIPLGPSGAPP